jgi:hypothetical protein
LPTIKEFSFLFKLNNLPVEIGIILEAFPVHLPLPSLLYYSELAETGVTDPTFFGRPGQAGLLIDSSTHVRSSIANKKASPYRLAFVERVTISRVDYYLP